MGDTVYRLLQDADKEIVRKRLVDQHRYFYHFTLECHFADIQKVGLDPYCEGEDSCYPARNFEPSKAIRYCTRYSFDVGRSTARERVQVWNDSLSMWVNTRSQVLIFRVPAISLLHRSFGLDHSFVPAREIEQMLESKTYLSADEFIRLITSFGSISCYEIIPPTELEFCEDDGTTPCDLLDGRFTSLLNYDAASQIRH